MFNTQRDKALMRVQQDADYIHNSAIPPAEKTQVLRSHVDEFREIDNFLQSLLTDLAGFAPDAKDPNVKAYLDVRDDAVKAINNFFTLVAKGEKVPNAGMTLNENLRDLAEHSASVQKTAPTLWRLKHATGDKFNKLIVGQLKEFDRVLKAFAVTGQQPKKGS